MFKIVKLEKLDNPIQFKKDAELSLLICGNQHNSEGDGFENFDVGIEFEAVGLVYFESAGSIGVMLLDEVQFNGIKYYYDQGSRYIDLGVKSREQSETIEKNKKKDRRKA